MSKDCLDVVTPFAGPTRCRPSQPPKRKVFIPIYPNTLPTVPKLSRSNRTAPLVVNNLEASQSAITRLLNRCTRENYSEVGLECAARCGNAQQGDEENRQKGQGRSGRPFSDPEAVPTISLSRSHRLQGRV